ncbi:MAG: hypothetical protein WAT84_03900 [Candidatus Moraniibacteriota bacterium]
MSMSHHPMIRMGWQAEGGVEREAEEGRITAPLVRWGTLRVLDMVSEAAHSARVEWEEM